MDPRQLPHDPAIALAGQAGQADDVGPADRLASVVAINASLIDRILRRGAELKRQRDDGVITEEAYGGEMYRLAKAVRHANGVIVGRLADHLPLSPPLPLTTAVLDARSRRASATDKPTGEPSGETVSRKEICMSERSGRYSVVEDSGGGDPFIGETDVIGLYRTEAATIASRGTISDISDNTLDMPDD